MSCRKVYQASEANKLFLMKFASIHGEDSYLYWGRGGGGGGGGVWGGGWGWGGGGGGGGGGGWGLWWMDLRKKM